MPPKKGGNASNQGSRSVDSITAPKAKARALFTKRQKKEGSHPLPVRRIAPSSKEQLKDHSGFTYWSSPLQPNDYWGQQPKKKQRSHPLPVFDAFTPLRMMPFYVRRVTKPPPVKEGVQIDRAATQLNAVLLQPTLQLNILLLCRRHIPKAGGPRYR